MARSMRQPRQRGIPPEHPETVTEYRHALEYACQRGQMDRAKWLVVQWRCEDNLENPTEDDFSWALSAAASGGKTATMSLLFEQGAKINRSTAQCAVEGGSLEVLQELLDRGWDINAKDSRGSPMLRHVVNNPDLVKFFIANGADLNQVDKRGGTALSTAIFSGASIDTVRLLLDHGADPSASNALHMAAAADNPQMIEFLLQKGARINQLQNESHPWVHEWSETRPMGSGTALFNAGGRGNRKSIEYLLKKGADPTIKDQEGDTAAQLARYKGYDDCAELLEAAEARWKRT